jgi:hypothetical protein
MNRFVLESLRSLWCGVITQAINDACSRASSVISDLEIETARRWLTTPSRDFNEVCALAGLEPDYVRRLASAEIAKAAGARVGLRLSTGETITVPEIAARTGLSHGLIRHRIAAGWSAERILATPKQTRSDRAKRYAFNGEELTLGEWSKRLGIAHATLASRLAKGWSVEAAFTTPPGPTRRATPRRPAGPGVGGNFGGSDGDRRGEPNARNNQNRVFA